MEYIDLVKSVRQWLGQDDEPDENDFPQNWRMEIRVDGNLKWSGDDTDECSLDLGNIVRFLVSGPTTRSVIVGRHSFSSGDTMTWVWEIQTADKELSP